jgi:hypothetical protein
VFESRKIRLLCFRCRAKKISENGTAAEKNNEQKRLPPKHSGISFLRDFFRIPHHKLLSCRHNRLEMRFGNCRFAISDVAFHALKLRVFFPLVNFIVKRAAVIGRRRDMTHIARRNRNFFRQRVGRVHRRYIMASRTILIGVARKLVAESSGRIALAPREQNNFVINLHRRSRFRVEIGFSYRRGELVASRAISRRGRNSRVRRMTRKTSRVTDWRGFESSLL